MTRVLEIVKYGITWKVEIYLGSKNPDDPMEIIDLYFLGDPNQEERKNAIEKLIKE